jgi:hypothetical protein
MYASVRQYRMAPGDVDEAMHIVDEGLAEQLAREPGFVAYQVIACGNGDLFSISEFRDPEGARRSNEIAAAFVAEQLADFDLTRTGAWTGEVMVSRAEAAVLEPAHH